MFSENKQPPLCHGAHPQTPTHSQQQPAGADDTAQLPSQESTITPEAALPAQVPVSQRPVSAETVVLRTGSEESCLNVLARAFLVSATPESATPCTLNTASDVQLVTYNRQTLACGEQFQNVFAQTTTSETARSSHAQWIVFVCDAEPFEDVDVLVSFFRVWPADTPEGVNYIILSPDQSRLLTLHNGSLSSAIMHVSCTKQYASASLSTLLKTEAPEENSFLTCIEAFGDYCDADLLDAVARNASKATAPWMIELCLVADDSGCVPNARATADSIAQKHLLTGSVESTTLTRFAASGPRSLLLGYLKERLSEPMAPSDMINLRLAVSLMDEANHNELPHLDTMPVLQGADVLTVLKETDSQRTASFLVAWCAMLSTITFTSFAELLAVLALLPLSDVPDDARFSEYVKGIASDLPLPTLADVARLVDTVSENIHRGRVWQHNTPDLVEALTGSVQSEDDAVMMLSELGAHERGNGQSTGPLASTFLEHVVTRLFTRLTPKTDFPEEFTTHLVQDSQVSEFCGIVARVGSRCFHFEEQIHTKAELVQCACSRDTNSAATVCAQLAVAGNKMPWIARLPILNNETVRIVELHPLCDLSAPPRGFTVPKPIVNLCSVVRGGAQKHLNEVREAVKRAEQLQFLFAYFSSEVNQELSHYYRLTEALAAFSATRRLLLSALSPINEVLQRATSELGSVRLDFISAVMKAQSDASRESVLFNRCMKEALADEPHPTPERCTAPLNEAIDSAMVNLTEFVSPNLSVAAGHKMFGWLRNAQTKIVTEALSLPLSHIPRGSLGREALVESLARQEEMMEKADSLCEDAQKLLNNSDKLTQLGFTWFKPETSVTVGLQALSDLHTQTSLPVVEFHDKCFSEFERLVGTAGPHNVRRGLLMLLSSLPDASNATAFFAQRHEDITLSGYSVGLATRLDLRISQLQSGAGKALEAFKEVGHIVAALLASRTEASLGDAMSALAAEANVARALSDRTENLLRELVRTLLDVNGSMHWIAPLLSQDDMGTEGMTLLEYAQVNAGFYIAIDCITKTVSLNYNRDKERVSVDGEYLSDLRVRFTFAAESDRSAGGKQAASVDALLSLIDRVTSSVDAVSQLHALQHPDFVSRVLTLTRAANPPVKDHEKYDEVTEEQLDNNTTTLADWETAINNSRKSFGFLPLLSDRAALQFITGLRGANAVAVLYHVLDHHPDNLANQIDALRTTLTSSQRSSWLDDLKCATSEIAQNMPLEVTPTARTLNVAKLQPECTLFNFFDSKMQGMLSFLDGVLVDLPHFSPLQILWCSPDVTVNHLQSFLAFTRRTLHKPFVLAACERLPRQAQQCLRDELLAYQTRPPNLLVLATAEMWLHEISDLRQLTPTCDNAEIRGTWEKSPMKLECFCGPAGCGKTYQLRKRLKELADSSKSPNCQCTIVVSENFTAASAASIVCDAMAKSIEPLQSVQIAVQFSVGGYDEKHDAAWMRLFSEVSLLLYNLVRLRHVSNEATGQYLSFVPAWDCTVLLELPPTDVIPGEDVMTLLPAFLSCEATATRTNCRDSPFDLDADDTLVAQYLKAFDDDTINAAAHRVDASPSMDVMFVLDISGSMSYKLPGKTEETRLSTCQKAIAKLLATFRPHDRCAVVAFSHTSDETPCDPCNEAHIAKMIAFTNAQKPDSDTRLWSTLSKEAELIFPDGEDAGDTRDKWWFVFTDGVATDTCHDSVRRFLRTPKGARVGVLFLAAGISPDAERIAKDTFVRDANRDKVILVSNSVQAYEDAFESAGQIMGVNEHIMKTEADITPEEVRTTIFKHMQPEKYPERTRIHMRHWLRCMHWHCTKFQSSRTFDKNFTKSNYGHATMEMMLAEAQHAMAQEHAVWDRERHEHVVYRPRLISDGKGGTVTDWQWSVIVADKKEDAGSRQRAADLKALNMCVPTREDCRNTNVLASYLAYGVGARLDEPKTAMSSSGQPFDFKIGELPLLKERKFVLTFDFMMKMLSIHERLECGVPCILMGETGVSKTALTNMLFALKNTFTRGPLVELMREYDVDTDRVASVAREVSVSMPANVSLEDACLTVVRGHPSLGAELLDELRCDPSLDVLTHFTVDELKQLEAPGSDEVAAKLLAWLARDGLSGQKRDPYAWCFKSVCVDAAMTAATIAAIFDEVIHRADRLSIMGKAFPTFELHHNAKICVFLDEFNTATCLGVLKEAIQDHSLNGNPLPDNVVVVAACNPLRKKLPLHGNQRAAEQKSDSVSGYYNVNPLPPSLEGIVWDYGSLSAAQEKEFIEQRAEQELPQLSQDERGYVADCIFRVHRGTRRLTELHTKDLCEAARKPCTDEQARQRARSALSIRDILRTFTMLDSLAHLPDEIAAVILGTTQARSNFAWTQSALNVSLMAVYYLRLSNTTEGYALTQRQQLDYDMRAVVGASMEETLDAALKRVAEKTTLRRGVVGTRALMENVFMVLLSVLFKVPLMIIGPPGSSKTLAVNTVIENCQNAAKKNTFYTRVGEVSSVHYQCSRQSTSREIEAVFNTAVDLQRGADHRKLRRQYFVFMDEAGLPEEERESLKVLHYLLEDHVHREAQVGFVAISNHILDAAKSNRCNVLLRGVPDDDDMMKCTTAYVMPERDVESPHAELAVDAMTLKVLTPEELLKSLNKAFRAFRRRELHPVTRVPAPQDSDMFGIRDFLHMHKLLGRLAEAHERHIDAQMLIRSVERNFGGPSPQNALEIVRYLLDGVVAEVPSVVINPVELLMDALAEGCGRDGTPVARYAAILTTTTDEGALRIIRRLLSPRDQCVQQQAPNNNKEAVFLAPNVFADNGIIADVALVNSICRAMEQGRRAVLSGAERVHEALYDLLNQYFMRFEDPTTNPPTVTLLTNVAIGTQSSSRNVSPNFRLALCFSPSELHSAPAPLLDRLEKYHVGMSDLLDYMANSYSDMVQTSLVMKVVAFVHQHMSKLVNSLPSNTFCGFVPSETIESALVCVLIQSMISFGRASAVRTPDQGDARGATSFRVKSLLHAAQQEVARLLVQVAIPEKLLLGCGNATSTNPLIEVFLEQAEMGLRALEVGPMRQLVLTCCDVAALDPRIFPGTPSVLFLSRLRRGDSLEKKLHDRLARNQSVVVLADLRTERPEALNYVRTCVDNALSALLPTGTGGLQSRVTVVTQMHSVHLRLPSVLNVTFSPDWEVRVMDDLNDTVTITWLKFAYQPARRAPTLDEALQECFGIALQDVADSFTYIEAIPDTAPSTASGVRPSRFSVDELRELLLGDNDNNDLQAFALERVRRMLASSNNGDDEAVQQQIREVVDQQASHSEYPTLVAAVKDKIQNPIAHCIMDVLIAALPLLLLKRRDTSTECLWSLLHSGLRSLPSPTLQQLQGPLKSREIRLSECCTFPFFEEVYQFLQTIAEETVEEEGNTTEELLHDRAETKLNQLSAQYVLDSVWDITDKDVVSAYAKHFIARQFPQLSAPGRHFAEEFLLRSVADTCRSSPLPTLHGVAYVESDTTAQLLMAADALVPLCPAVENALWDALGGCWGADPLEKLTEAMLSYMVDQMKTPQSSEQWSDWVAATQRLPLDRWETLGACKNPVGLIKMMRSLFFAHSTIAQPADDVAAFLNDTVLNKVRDTMENVRSIELRKEVYMKCISREVKDKLHYMRHLILSPEDVEWALRCLEPAKDSAHAHENRLVMHTCLTFSLTALTDFDTFATWILSLCKNNSIGNSGFSRMLEVDSDSIFEPELESAHGNQSESLEMSFAFVLQWWKCQWGTLRRPGAQPESLREFTRATRDLVAQHPTAPDTCPALCALLDRALHDERMHVDVESPLLPEPTSAYMLPDCRDELQTIQTLSLLWVIPVGWELYAFLDDQLSKSPDIDMTMTVRAYLQKKNAPRLLRSWQLMCALASAVDWLPFPKLSSTHTLADVVSIKKHNGSVVPNALHDTIRVLLEAYASVLRACPHSGDEAPHTHQLETIEDAGLPDADTEEVKAALGLEEDDNTTSFLQLSDDEVFGLLRRHLMRARTCSEYSRVLAPALFACSCPDVQNAQEIRQAAINSAKEQMDPVIESRGVHVDSHLYPVLCTVVEPCQAGEQREGSRLTWFPQLLCNALHRLNHDGLKCMIDNFTQLQEQVRNRHLERVSIRSAADKVAINGANSLIAAFNNFDRSDNRDFEALLAVPALRLPMIVDYLKAQLQLGAYLFCEYPRTVKAPLSTITLRTIQTELRDAGLTVLCDLERLVLQRESAIQRAAHEAKPASLIAVLFADFRSREHAVKLYPCANRIEQALAQHGDEHALLCSQYVSLRLLLSNLHHKMSGDEGAQDDPYIWTWADRLPSTTNGATNTTGVMAATASDVHNLPRAEVPLSCPAVDDVPCCASAIETRRLMSGKAREHRKFENLPSQAQLIRGSWATLRSALEELDRLPGRFKRIKKHVDTLIHLAEDNSRRQMSGEEPRIVNLNTVFLGDPGTGKTTVAKLYGKILCGCGFLSDGAAVVRHGDDLIGQDVQQTQANISRLLEACKGKLLIIKEANAMFSAPTCGGQEVIEMLTRSVRGDPKEDTAVVLIDCTAEMPEVMRRVSPGAASRFNEENAFIFESYSYLELRGIMALLLQAKGIRHWSPEVEKMIMHQLSRHRDSGQFRNAHTLDELLTDAIRTLTAPGTAATTLTLVDLRLKRAPPNLKRALALLKDLYGLDEVHRHLKQLFEQMQHAPQENTSQDSIVRNYLFVGNAGTGKTTVARAFGRILYELGCIARPHVENRTVEDLQSRRVGRSASAVRDAMDAACGGVLFIDNAAALSKIPSVADELVALMASPEHMGHTVVILAGRTREMDEMAATLRNVNMRFANRFSERLEFADWSPEDCVAATERWAAKRQLTLDDATSTTLKGMFTVIQGRPEWENARDCHQTWEWIALARKAAPAEGGAEADDKSDRVAPCTEDIVATVVKKWDRLHRSRYSENDAEAGPLYTGPTAPTFVVDREGSIVALTPIVFRCNAPQDGTIYIPVPIGTAENATIGISVRLTGISKGHVGCGFVKKEALNEDDATDYLMGKTRHSIGCLLKNGKAFVFVNNKSVFSSHTPSSDELTMHVSFDRKNGMHVRIDDDTVNCDEFKNMSLFAGDLYLGISMSEEGQLARVLPSDLGVPRFCGTGLISVADDMLMSCHLSIETSLCTKERWCGHADKCFVMRITNACCDPIGIGLVSAKLWKKCTDNIVGSKEFGPHSVGLLLKDYRIYVHFQDEFIEWKPLNTMPPVPDTVDLVMRVSDGKVSFFYQGIPVNLPVIANLTLPADELFRATYSMCDRGQTAVIPPNLPVDAPDNVKQRCRLLGDATHMQVTEGSRVAKALCAGALCFSSEAFAITPCAWDSYHQGCSGCECNAPSSDIRPCGTLWLCSKCASPDEFALCDACYCNAKTSKHDHDRNTFIPLLGAGHNEMRLTVEDAKDSYLEMGVAPASYEDGLGVFAKHTTVLLGKVSDLVKATMPAENIAASCPALKNGSEVWIRVLGPRMTVLVNRRIVFQTTLSTEDNPFMKQPLRFGVRMGSADQRIHLLRTTLAPNRKDTIIVVTNDNEWLLRECEAVELDISECVAAGSTGTLVAVDVQTGVIDLNVGGRRKRCPLACVEESHPPEKPNLTSADQSSADQSSPFQSVTPLD